MNPDDRPRDSTVVPPFGGLALEAAPPEALASLYGPIIEATADAIVITDLQRRVSFANRAAAELFGIPRERLLGVPVAVFVPDEELAEVLRREQACFDGSPQRYETTVQRPCGERRAVSVSTGPLREGDAIVGTVATLRDITAERRARDAVAQSEARYRNLFDSASEAIYSLDVHGAFTSANRATCEMTGYPLDALLGRRPRDLVMPDEADAIGEHFRTAKAGIPCRFEAHFRRADGELRTASVTLTPIRREGRVTGVLGMTRDVTDERRRERELRRAHQRYQKLVESAWDAIFTVDADGRFTSVNEGMVSGVGVPREQLLGRRFSDIVEPVDQQAMWDTLQGVLRGERLRREVRFRDANGEVRVGSLTLTPLVDDGDTVAALGIVRDVTDERRLGEQLLQREKLAAVGQLVSGVAHELNNPLAGIMAFSQLLLASPPADRSTVEALGAINKEAKRAAKIISNLLLFARQRPPERRATDLNAVIADSLALRRYALQTHQVAVECHLDADLPAVCADASQLQQVFLNLLTNAEQAVQDREGEKRITVTTRRRGDRVEALVRDSGPGVPADVQDRIFNPFFSTKKVGEGTGLGLSISDGIIREHGGHIRLESEPGRGACFIVELPVPAEEGA